MTYSSDQRDNYTNQGQQDDYFDQDLATAGHEPKKQTPQEKTVLDEYNNQRQQDDHFNEDLANNKSPQT